MSTSAPSKALVAIVALLLLLPATALSGPPRKTGEVKQVGHEPLMNRGMNAAPRSTATTRTSEAGPTAATRACRTAASWSWTSRIRRPNLLGPPLDAKPGESSRELRVWRSQDILIVLNTNCGVGDTLHHCTQPSISNFRFYDISGGTRPDRSSSTSSTWTPTSSSCGRTRESRSRADLRGQRRLDVRDERRLAPCPFSVWDISPVRDGQAPVTLYSGLHRYTQFPPAARTRSDADGRSALALGQQ